MCPSGVCVCVCVCVCVSHSVMSSSLQPHEARQGPLSMEFCRQEYWSRLLITSPGDFSNPEIELRCPALQADSSLTEPPGKPSVAYMLVVKQLIVGVSKMDSTKLLFQPER